MHICSFFVRADCLRVRHQRNLHLLSLLLVALSTLLLAACSSTSSTPNPPPSVQVAVSPTAASVFTNQNEVFTATVTGTSNTSVTWSVQEGASGGSITNAGLYSAPANAGTFHVSCDQPG